MLKIWKGLRSKSLVGFESSIVRRSYSHNVENYTPRRSLMYVPGNDRRKIAKIPQLNADMICLDCEDGVSILMKETARSNIRKILDQSDEELNVDFGKSELSVRINSADCDELGVKDLEVIFQNDPKRLPSSIHLPKCNSPNDIEWLTEELSKYKPRAKMGLIIFIESAMALLDSREIIRSMIDISKKSGYFSPEAAVFGSDDFVADIGATRTPNAAELLYARQKFVTTVKAFGLQAIDLVHIDYKDHEGLKLQSEEGARMGFTGKQVIHPGQIKIVQEAFTPSAEKIKWARELVDEFKIHEKSGKGAFTFRGQMIDMPLVKQAHNILRITEI